MQAVFEILRLIIFQCPEVVIDIRAALSLSHRTLCVCRVYLTHTIGKHGKLTVSAALPQTMAACAPGKRVTSTRPPVSRGAAAGAAVRVLPIAAAAASTLGGQARTYQLRRRRLRLSCAYWLKAAC